jgi:GT2 family glycosyltransferase
MTVLRNADPSARLTPRVFALGDGAAVVILDLAGRATPRLELEGGERLAPLATLRLRRSGGGVRMVWGLRRRSDLRPLNLYASTLGAPLALAVAGHDNLPEIDGATLIDGIETRDRINLVSALLGVWTGLLRLRGNRAFTELVAGLVAALKLKPQPARLVTALDGRHRVVATLLDGALGEVKAVYRVTPEQSSALAIKPYLRADGARLRTFLAGEFAAGDLVVVIGAGGLAIRKVAPEANLLPLRQWWRTASADPGLRAWIAGLVADAPLKNAAMGRELQLSKPLRAIAVTGQGGLPSAQVNLAIGTAGGVFAGGWLKDPNRLVAAIELVDGTHGPTPISVNWQTFPTEIADERVTGFVAWVRDAGAAAHLLQPRFELALESGSRQPLVPAVQPCEAGDRRAAVLRAIPPEYLTDRAVGPILAPALAGLQAEFVAGHGAPEVEEMGLPVPDPAISIVIPLYKVLDFLRTQVACFAADARLAAGADIIYVLDSPEQAEDVRNLLRGLNLLYALPMRLAVMPRNGGYAHACNAGAALARAPVIAMLNSDVIPAASGWADPLLASLEAFPRWSAVGPKLLFEDESLQHAGLYFERDQQGRWLNHHFFKGLPRHFADANIERIVPAVTGAALTVRRSLFEKVGGFTEDFVIGDYEDSDLCLKLRREGSMIGYVPASELYHFERQSIRKSADYMRGAAARYNSWLQTQRWAAEMEALHAEFVKPMGDWTLLPRVALSAPGLARAA